MAIYLSGIGYLREGDVENALVDFTRLYEAAPDNQLFQKYYVTLLKQASRSIPEALKGVAPFDFPLNRDCVYVIFGNGRGSAFKQIAIYFPVMTAWPVCEYYTSPYRNFTIQASGESHKSVLLSDMDGVISQEYQERLPGMVTRIILSTAVKEGISYTAAAVVAQEDEAAGLAILLGSMVYRAIYNTADTRSWELLPKEFQIIQLPRPADGRLELKTEGGKATSNTFELPSHAKSALIYIHSPSANVFQSTVMPISK